MLRDSDHAVIVAGGSGIAVAWPLVWAVLGNTQDEDPEDAAKATNTKLILFIWIIREKSHLAWLGPEKVQQLQDRGVGVEIPPPTAEAGHPDIGFLVSDWVAAVHDRTTDCSTIGVVASGPDGMNRAVRNTCASMAWQGRSVSVEIEKFGW
ncbi:hypothetical protein P7C71_g1080, partial [Lecanoromycetidae sp. Uapishka_2]